MTIKAGTRVEIKGHDMNGATTWEAATIKRWSKISGPREDMPGWHAVRYQNGTVDMLVHESGFRVVDNRT